MRPRGAIAQFGRRRAFAVARYVIEELKRRVPIWKREHYVDGTREWVSAATESSAQLADIGDER